MSGIVKNVLAFLKQNPVWKNPAVWLAVILFWGIAFLYWGGLYVFTYYVPVNEAMENIPLDFGQLLMSILYGRGSTVVSVFILRALLRKKEIRISGRKTWIIMAFLIGALYQICSFIIPSLSAILDIGKSIFFSNLFGFLHMGVLLICWLLEPFILSCLAVGDSAFIAIRNSVSTYRFLGKRIFGALVIFAPVTLVYALLFFYIQDGVTNLAMANINFPYLLFAVVPISTALVDTIFCFCIPIMPFIWLCAWEYCSLYFLKLKAGK